MNPPLSEHMWTTIRISMSARMSGASDTLRPPLCHLTPHSPIVLQPSWLCLTICKRLIHFVFLNKYNLKFGQIYCAIWMHTFSNFKKSTICNLDKYSLQFGHFQNWTDTFYPCGTRHHIPELSSGNIQTLLGHVLLIPNKTPISTYYLVISILHFLLSCHSILHLVRLIFTTFVSPKLSQAEIFREIYFVKLFTENSSGLTA